MTVPTSPEGYQPLFDRRPGIPEGTKIDTSHPRWKSATATAHAAGLSQEQFSKLLTHEVESHVRASHPAPAAPPAAPAPRPAAPSADAKPYAERSFAEKLAAAGHL